MITTKLMISLLLILCVAWAMGGLFRRMGLPPILGELLAGLVLGPPVLGIIGPSPAIELLAEFGIFFVMFYTGLEQDPKVLLKYFWPSFFVALGGFVLPFVLGFFAARLFGATVYQSLFVGMGVSITAIAVQAVILHSMGISRTSLGHIIMGAAIADDIFALVGLSVLTGVAKTGAVQYADVGIVFLKAATFFGVVMALGHYVMPKLTPRLHDGEGMRPRRRLRLLPSAAGR